jgi:UDP-N-acetylglucosamine/UDP-N-acetylgalactosamine diphosphorylase
MTISAELSAALKHHRQDHLLVHLETLAGSDKEAFATRLAQIDWEELEHAAEPPDLAEIGPSRVFDFAARATRAAQLREVGESCLLAGQVAILMVAGGQGTRLGLTAPKGCFPIAPHSNKTIYQLQAEKVLSLSRRCNRSVPFLVMTSPMTDVETRAFFVQHQNFGLQSEQVRFFSQSTVPSLDADGRALLAGPGKLLENPDGHGGCFTALVASGNLERLRREGVTQIVYIQVDNILAPVDDIELVGLATIEKADVVTKVLEKAHPDEKLGHLVCVGRADRIVEYTEVTPEQARMRNASGDLIYRWGSPAMHCWSVAFLGRLADRGYKLPLHRSSKPLKAWTASGIVPTQGWKSERFIFDLIPEAAVSVGLEICRDDEFAPVKNASGDDSAETAVALAHRQYVRWLKAAGVAVELPESARVEIGPLFAATEAQFLKRWDRRFDNLQGDLNLQG